MAAAEPGAEVLAAIDIGTNSVHLVVPHMAPGHTGPRPDVLEREKEMVRLGSSGGDMKQLTADAIERGVKALGRFRQVAEVHGAEVRAVATSAVREAENRHDFLERARVDAGVEVEVISGTEEARLIHLGVLQAVPVYDRRLVLCDIGGGSTELLVGERDQVLASRSLKLGAIRLTRRFFDGRVLHPAAVDSCRRYIRSTITPFAREVRRLAPEVGVGSSGTIASLAEMAAMRSGGNRPRTVSNLVLGRRQLSDLVGELVATPTSDARAELPGLDPKRADIILAGSLILDEVMRALRLDELVVSDYALREGVLLDTWRRRHGTSLHHLSDLRRRSVLHLVELMDDDPQHSVHVARLALQLFDATVEHHGHRGEARELLEAAALLSNVGQFIAHAQHHLHSYYVIRNSEHLAGFTDREVELVALIARYHRKSAPKSKHAEFSALRKDDQKLVRAMAGLLRVAIGLDRNHDGRVLGLRPVTDGTDLVLDLDARDGQDVSLELYAADARKDLLEEVLGRTVRLRSGDPPS
jgi:exopolyphosphatase / guanosine-5'-triphosphate,3'-diphosphate pyrophosphatase